MTPPNQGLPASGTPEVDDGFGQATEGPARTPSDEVAEPKGPLTVVRRTSANPQSRPIHLLSQEGRGIGCGWVPCWDKIRTLTKED